MPQMKQAWITEHDAGFVKLSIESEHAEPEYQRLSAREMTFPDRETGRSRHTIAIGLLAVEDLVSIQQAIETYLANNI